MSSIAATGRQNDHRAARFIGFRGWHEHRLSGLLPKIVKIKPLKGRGETKPLQPRGVLRRQGLQRRIAILARQTNRLVE